MADEQENKVPETAPEGGTAEAKAPQAAEAAGAKPAPRAPGGRPQGGGRGGDRGRRGPDRGDRGPSGRGGRGGRRGRRDREPDEPEENPYQETLIDVYRCSATVKGGRRLSFGALVTVGDSKGQVGIGYGKAKEVPGAIQKAMKRGRLSMKPFPRVGDGTIPHQVVGRFGASRVILVPARPGTGLIASAAVKAVLEAGGLKNVLTKSVGSNNTRNVVKAVMNALAKLRSREQVQALRGVGV